MSFGVKMNVRARHKFLRMGGLCWLVNTNIGWANERFIIWGMSRGGRNVETWVDARDVHKLRPGWIADNDQRRFPFDTKEQAQRWADVVGTRYAQPRVESE